MRRSICYSEPAYALAGQTRTWSFIHTSSIFIPKGALLKFDLLTEGRSIDWEIPNPSKDATCNALYALTESGKVFYAKEIRVKDRLTPQYEFTLPEAVEIGESITFVLGTPYNTKPTSTNGNKAQCTTQRRKNFHLYIDPTGKNHYSDPEVFSIDIRGNVLKNISILVPSLVIKNKRFDVIARFEDEYGNLTGNAPEDTLIELNHENIRENLNWKLFVPETGFINLPNLYFNEPGIYTIVLKNLNTGEVFKGPPVACLNDSKHLLFWGVIHGESEKVDSSENIENCLRHFRDEKAYNFFAASPYQSVEETSPEMWKLCSQNITEFDEADRFTTFLGFQWSGVPEVEGARQIIFAKDNKQIIRKKDPKGTTLKKLYKNFAPKEIISIPLFTMGEDNSFNFDDFDPEFERVVEIYNAWGSSESTAKEGNPRPIHCNGKTGVNESKEGSIVNALLKNCRFGFVAGGLDDRGIFSELYENDQVQYTPGLTAIMAAEHTRASIFDALYQRYCYATTGERMILNYTVAGVVMGGEITTADKPGLLVNRHINGYAAGTKPLTKIEIVRNGKVIHTITPETGVSSLFFNYDDMTPFDTIMHDNKDKKPPFVFYYIRIFQEDGHMAWGSPIWIDYILLSLAERRARRIAKPIKSMAAIDSFKDDLDFDLQEEEEEEEEEEHDDDELLDDEDDEDDVDEANKKKKKKKKS